MPIDIINKAEDEKELQMNTVDRNSKQEQNKDERFNDGFQWMKSIGGPGRRVV
jgi:hypothetical protein